MFTPRWWLWVGLLLLAVSPLSAQDLPVFPAGRAGLQAMLTYLLDASPKTREAYSRNLWASREDCDSLFADDLAREVYRYQRRLRRTARIVVRPLMAAQTELLLWQAEAQELLDYVGEARFFPGGYHELAPRIRPGYIFYRCKFVEPGRHLGSAYDVFVHVNGQWRLIHRPWAVMFE